MVPGDISDESSIIMIIKKNTKYLRIEKINYECINIQPLEEKKMVMIGTEFKIIGVSEAYITGHGILFNSTGYNVRIILNRYNGELSVNFFETESMTSKDYLHSYKTLCKKAKKLI